jgi:alkylated DNA repair dioxygenase AlkB
MNFLVFKVKMKFSIALDSENSINYISDFLDLKEQDSLNYLIASTTLAQPTLKIYGNSPKFFDTTFATKENTAPSRHYKQATVTPQILEFSNLLKTKYDLEFQNQATNHYNCNLVYYAPHLANGGNRGKHQDNPKVPLNLVLIYSYGQTRTLTVSKDNKKVQRITMHHNSVLAMSGPTFQKIYHHQLDSLKKGSLVEDRWSFNTRFI